MPKRRSGGQGEGVGNLLETPGSGRGGALGADKRKDSPLPDRAGARARPEGAAEPERSGNWGVLSPARGARLETLGKQVEKNRTSAREWRRRQGQKPQSPEERARVRGRAHQGLWGRLLLGSERHQERRGGAEGECRGPGKGEEEARRTKPPGARGNREGSLGGCAGSPGAAQRCPCRPSLAARGPNPLTMMEKTKATMLMGYAGQKQETMASHR